MHRRRDVLTAEIEEVFLAHPFGEVLLSLPGIGPRTGPRILAEIGDGSRFENGSKLASFCTLQYNVIRHEFGHTLGLRHSDAPCADVAEFAEELELMELHKQILIPHLETAP